MTAPEQPYLIHVERAADMPPIQTMFNPSAFLHASDLEQQADGCHALSDWLAAVLYKENMQEVRGKHGLTLHQHLYAMLGGYIHSIQNVQHLMEGEGKRYEHFSISGKCDFSNAQRYEPLPPDEMLAELKAMKALALKVSNRSSAPYHGDRVLMDAWCQMVREQVLPPIYTAIAREEAFLRDTEASLAKGSEPNISVMGKHTREVLERIAASPHTQPGRGKS